MVPFIVSTMLVGVEDAEIQAQYHSARLTLCIHNPSQAVRRFGGLGPKSCPHHQGDARWDDHQHGCADRLHSLKMILTLTYNRPDLRRELVVQGLITQTEADHGIVPRGIRKRGGHRRNAKQTSPNPQRPLTRAVGVARVVAP